MARRKPAPRYPLAVPPSCLPQRLLRGQCAVVTGSSSGIGRAVALALAEAGADVAVNYARRGDAARELAARIRGLGRRALALEADVSRERDVRRLFSRAIRGLGRVDILVNNAGIQKDAPFESMTLADWRSVLDVNLTGQFLCAREAVRHYKRKGVIPSVSCAAGKILCVSSVHELIPWAGHVNYAASKGGVMLMMRSVAQEVAPWRIRVNSIAPGAIRTPLNRRAWSAPAAYRALLEKIPYNRIGEPEEIGRAAAWLLSDQADYVHGVTLFVDGGMTLYPGFETGG